MSQELWIFLILLPIGIGIICAALILGKPYRQPINQIINLQLSKEGFNFKIDVWSFFALLGVIIIGAGIFIVYQSQEYQREQDMVNRHVLENRIKQLKSGLKEKANEINSVKAEKVEQIGLIIEKLKEHSIDIKFSFKEQDPFPRKITSDMVTVLIFKEGGNAPVEHQYTTIIPGVTNSAIARIRKLKPGDMVSILVQEGDNIWRSQFFKIPLTFPVDSWDGQ